MVAIVTISLIVLVSPVCGYWLMTAKLSLRTKLIVGGIVILALGALPLLLTIFPSLGTGT